MLRGSPVTPRAGLSLVGVEAMTTLTTTTAGVAAALAASALVAAALVVVGVREGELVVGMSTACLQPKLLSWLLSF
jgi:hypothetical protein